MEAIQCQMQGLVDDDGGQFLGANLRYEPFAKKALPMRRDGGCRHTSISRDPDRQAQGQMAQEGILIRQERASLQQLRPVLDQCS